MKVLMMFPYAPQPPPLDLAGTKRNLPFFLALAKHHEVSVLSFGTPAEARLFREHYGKMAKEIRFVDRRRPQVLNVLELLALLGRRRSSFRRIYRHSMQCAVDEMVRTGGYDLIHCCSHMFGFYQLPKHIPVSADTHDVVYEQMRRTAATTRNLFWKAKTYWDYRFGKGEELSLCRKFCLIVTATETDRTTFLHELPGRNVVAIQNGVPEAFSSTQWREPEPCTMVFTGLFSHVPNSDGALYFLNSIFPKILRQEPGARVMFVGKNPTRAMLARAADNVIITGFVDDVRPFMARAQVFIIPLLAGTGIRTKALEAMAMRVPIVTTSLGVEGINLQDGDSALYGDRPESFADAVIRLFRDGQLRQRIAERAFLTVRAEHSWEIQGRRFEQTLCRSVESFRTQRSVARPLKTHDGEPFSTPLNHV